MKYKNIVFLVETPFLIRDYERYGIDILQENGFDVSVIDLSPLILKTAYNSIKTDLINYSHYNILRIFTYLEFKNIISSYNSDETMFLCNMGYLWKYRKVFRLLKKKRLHFGYLLLEMTPGDSGKILSNNNNIVKRIYNGVTRRIPKGLQGVQFADFIIGCGADLDSIESFKRGRLCKKNCPIIYFHSWDYDDCIALNSQKENSFKNYCVFIDQYLPFHPDLIEMGININADAYYSKMTHFLLEIEKQFECKVIVAAHPRSNYGINNKYFNEFTIVKNRTCELIKNSKLVIFHFSTSMGYVCLLKKPFIQVVSDDILNTHKNTIFRISNYFCNKIFNVDSELKRDLKDYVYINDNRYCEFVTSYMKANYKGIIEDRPLWVQISNYLKGM